ncbi:phytoene/squalene synthase family protein [Nocardioides zeae]|uniref:Phytoene/squalene synthase family protein n=1 Tax=Nocardioides imazamoxiresistens TaxID=3231893 RepID=A0ABU3PQK7_9ACTN|nr:phytoene/squalene synthase family protein [Nocardioides zeae]MDT9591461.1 phytoene/squalene synthase family protein [Nocardioides zeae]
MTVWLQSATPHRGPRRPDQQYDDVADASASLVIRSYSSSFGLASRLLAPDVRVDVRNVYALVRVADEIVDAPRPDSTPADQLAALDALEAEVAGATASGSSANLVVHAFARTARRCGIGADLTGPFFASMRTDVERTVHDEESLAVYVHGSAEVVGLMCLRAFLADEPRAAEQYALLSAGAQRLGAAFQKVNFLRDLGEDGDLLGRTYLVGLDPRDPDERAWRRWLDDVDADLTAAASAVTALPRSSRLAVCTAHDLFAELSARLRRTTAAEACAQRVRVPGPVKARLAARALLADGRPRRVGAAGAAGAAA